MSENLSLLSSRKGLEENLFEKLLIAAKEEGTPDSETLKNLAEAYLIGNATTYGAASFYDFLKPQNKGKKVHTCNGTACLMANSQEPLNKELEKHFKAEEIGHICCLGRCHENGAFKFQDKNYSGKTAQEIAQILAGKAPKNANLDFYSVGSNFQPAILTAPFSDIDTYYSVFEKALKTNANELLSEIKKSNLRGRGGAGFPMGFKFEACKNEISDQKYIVCNADEGDPGAYSDRYLLEQQPHSVLFGMMIAAYIIGANRGVLYIRAEYPEAIKIIAKAIKELENKGLNGENILGSGFDFRFKIIEGAGAYVCGEETALLSSIEGQRPEVRVRPPYPTQEGLFNKPTVVNNVETLAAIHNILELGGEKFATIGTKKSAGTKLVSLDSFFNTPGIYEIEMGTPLSEVLEKFGGGFTTKVKALHIGGPLGGVVPVHKIKDLTLDFESFSENGFLLGHAGIVCIPESYPMIKYLEHLFEFTALESCGKCFPCSIGSVRGQEMLSKAQKENDYKIDKTLMNDLLETLEVGSLCALGGGLPIGVKNTLQYFEDELNTYFS